MREVPEGLPLKGQVELIRLVRADRWLRVLGREFLLGETHVREYVLARLHVRSETLTPHHHGHLIGMRAFPLGE